MKETLGIYHKQTGELIAYPFADSERGLNEIVAFVKRLNYQLKDLTVHTVPEEVDLWDY